MKITIKIPDSALKTIVDHIEEYSDGAIKTTVAKLKANPKLVTFIQSDLDTMYFEDFGDGLDDVDVAEALGLS